MKKYGLIGKTIGHSLSPRLHGYLGDYGYELFDLPNPDMVEAVLGNEEYSGFNVTSPYKETVAPFMDELSDEARALGAVNTIMRTDDGRLVGYNTDVYGFEMLIGADAVCGKSVLVLGSGGASRAARVGLSHLGASRIIVCSRHPESIALYAGEETASYDDLAKHVDVQVIVNATPVGMEPNTSASPLDGCPVKTSDFRSLELVLDLIYKPYRTKLLLDAETSAEVEVKSGLEMLIYQGIKSNAIWQGCEPQIEKAVKIYEELLNI